MSAYIKSSRVIIYIFVPVLFSLILSALVNLQLFQDGSSYLFELLVSDSAIRHHRLSVYLIQMPAIVTDKLLTRWQADSDTSLQITRLIFSLSYSLIPLISLTLSWLVIRRKHEGLFIWTALIILFVNLVNFSWVSELLIALQLACPLLLASLLMPGTKPYWILMVILLPIIFFLHPLVLLLFVTLASGSVYVSYENGELRKAAQFSAVIFLTAALLRGLLSFYMLTSYETSFLESGEMNEYLFLTSFENKLFLIMSLLIGLICLLAKSFEKFGRNTTLILLLIVPIQALALLLFLTNLNFLSSFYKFLILVILIALAVGS